MEVSFSTAKLAKICNSAKKLRGEYGPRMADLIQQRLAELKAADTLADMRSLPGARCHELKGNLAGHLAVDLVHPNRMVFVPDHDPVPTKDDGGMNWDEITAVVVIGIGDYH